MQRYRAVIVDPDRPWPAPDIYGTVTLLADPSTYGNSRVVVYAWAIEALKKAGPNAEARIYETVETLIATLPQTVRS